MGGEPGAVIKRDNVQQETMQEGSCHLILWVVVFGEVGVGESFLSCGSLVRIHVQQLQQQVDGIWVGPHKELIEVLLLIVRQGGQVAAC